MADPTALQTATAAAQAVQLIGMPEAKLALAQATIHLATAPKSGAVVAAIGAAMADVAAGKAARCRRTCATGTTPAPRGWVMPKVIVTRIGIRTVFSHNNIRRTSSSASTTTNPPTTVPNGTSRFGWESCGDRAGFAGVVSGYGAHRLHNHSRTVRSGG